MVFSVFLVGFGLLDILLSIYLLLTDPYSIGVAIACLIIGILVFIYSIFRLRSEIQFEKKHGDKGIGKSVGTGILVIAIVLLIVVGIAKCAANMQYGSDEETYHYLDMNGNDQLDDGEHHWTEDSDGHVTDFDW